MSIPSHLDDVLYPLNQDRHSHPNSFYSDEMASVSIELSRRELASECTAIWLLDVETHLAQLFKGTICVEVYQVRQTVAHADCPGMDLTLAWVVWLSARSVRNGSMNYAYLFPRMCLRTILMYGAAQHVQFNCNC